MKGAKPLLSAAAVILALLVAACECAAQQSPIPRPQNTPPPKPRPIQDNSFLIEEAYNQEEGIIQHINTFSRQRGGDWVYTFTQEWPVFSQKHQLSFTIPAQRVSGPAGRRDGLGDIAINYRYQLAGSGDARVAVAPRFSLLLPTGDERRGLGAGAPGVQVNLPLSVVMSDRLVTHWNAGTTITPSSKNDRGDKATLKDFSLGQSFIWLAAPNFNVMLETFWQSEEAVIGHDLRRRENSLLLGPGARWAYNFKSGLQIVPGIATHIGLGPSRGERSLFIYLSFEHPFKKLKE
ncbi:MAG TPA: transporter [Blastocatellia bacterium]